jgi:tRNA(Ile2) C34 agmatinyltransferase TiaS
MDVLSCPACGRQYAVSGAGNTGGWRCTLCSAELETVEREVSRTHLVETEQALTFDGHLHPLVPPGTPPRAE